MPFALSAFPSEKEITQDRDIIIEFYWLTAMGAIRGGG